MLLGLSVVEINCYLYATKITTMQTEKRVELLVKVVGTLLTFFTVIIGIWQFNKGQRDLKDRDIEQRKAELTELSAKASIEMLSKFKELQMKIYLDAGDVLSYLIVNEDFRSAEYKAKVQRFWELYWVELAVVETPKIESTMMQFGNILKDMQDHDFSNFKERQHELELAGYAVAQAIKQSASVWELPDGLKNKELKP